MICVSRKGLRVTAFQTYRPILMELVLAMQKAGCGTRRAMNIRVIVFSFTLLSSSYLFARDTKDVIVMKNGDRMTCEIKGLSAGVLSVRLKYVQGAIGVQWSEVASLDSNQLFLVQTESGTVYTGTLSTAGTSGERPVTIEVASVPEKEVEISKPQIVRLDQTDERFWRKLSGTITTGILYSKGNEATQYNIASEVDYRKARWSSEASFNSNFSSGSSANVSTRNQIDTSSMRLLRWNNWFYSGTGSFLQSSVQGIDLQTNLGGGIGRYLKNSNQTTLYVLGGLGWQNVQYKSYTPNQAAQNTATALVAAELKVFRFKKTDLDVSTLVLPEISQAGRVRTNANASYYIKLVGELSWNLSFYGNWDNQPPPTLKGSNYGSSSGLSWRFGNR
jgi:Protein of unknown function, DUF481